MKVLITGPHGFIGQNLRLHLENMAGIEILSFAREDGLDSLSQQILKADFILHMAGVNRPLKDTEFTVGNTKLTSFICQILEESSKKTPVIFSSSIQANVSSPYGLSKLSAEKELINLHEVNGNPISIFRLPNVFGKGARPNYNSVVATFCLNIAREIPITIDDANVMITLVYIDDVVQNFLQILTGNVNETDMFKIIKPSYEISVGDLATKILEFKSSRNSLITERVGCGFDRALYSTFLTYLPKEAFTYELKAHSDQRGDFVEFLKTGDSGQISYFTSGPQITRGNHFHHTKNEKFLVLKGTARFRFENLLNGETYEVTTSANDYRVVETVPGWGHEITNIGANDMIVMLWANEIFDPLEPDTYSFDFSGFRNG